jgi:N-acyl amino acid synthase of PEP-CTERM/exosortase system
MKQLAEKFSRYFRVNLAVTPQQKRYSYAIRHQVYAEELGWELQTETRLETDNYDAFSHHCLLEHKRSGDLTGCVRLVLPSIGRPESKLPCQAHEIPMLNDRRLSDGSSESVGEVSRLAVLNSFRAQEASKPFMLDNYNGAIYSDEERRCFPYISTGLYLSAIALVDLCGLDRVLVVMEPRLQRHLLRSGLVFHQISETFELRGRRALFELPSEELTVNMNEQVLELYRIIRHDLSCQLESTLPPRIRTTSYCDALHR